MLKTKGHLKSFRAISLFVVLLFASIINLFSSRASFAEITPDKQAEFEVCMGMDINIDPQNDDEKKKADEQADEIVKCVKDAGFTDQEAMMECSDTKYIGSGVSKDDAMKNRVRCDAIEGTRVRTTPKDEDGNSDEGEKIAEGYTDPCYAANEALSWFTCPLIDGLSSFMTRIYTSIVEEWLVFDPQILTVTTNETTNTNAAKDAWGSFRTYANIFFVLVLFFIIFAQFTGFGEGRYNLRAMLPRFIALVVVVNISYPICQIAVDLSNILGSGIANLFIEFSSHIELENAGGVAGMSIFASVIVAVVIAAVAIVVAAIAVGPAFLMPIIMALLGGVLTVFFTYLMLVVRQAVMIILVVASPVAIAMAVLPGTKSIFDKWFKLFRGLLLTYPIASLLMMGGNFAARLVMKVWNGESFIMAIVSMAICIVPITMLPKITRSALASLDGLVLKAQNGITKFAGKRLSETRFATDANNIKAEKTQRRRSFTYRGKDGNLHSIGDKLADNRVTRRFMSEDTRNSMRSKLNGMRTTNMDRNLAGAQKSNAALNRFALYDDAGNIGARDDAKRVSEQSEIQESQGITSQSAELGRMNAILGNDDEYQTRAATEHLLSQGEAGRMVLMQALSNNGISTQNQQTVARTIMEQGFGEMEGQNVRLANWARDVVNSGSGMQVGRIDQYQLSGDAMRRMTGSKLEAQDTSEVQYLEQRVNAIESGAAPEFSNASTTPAQIANLQAGAQSVRAAASAYTGSESYKGATNAKREVIERLKT